MILIEFVCFGYVKQLNEIESKSCDKTVNKKCEYFKIYYKAYYEIIFRNKKKSVINFTNSFLRYTNVKLSFYRSFDHVRSVFERKFFRNLSRESQNACDNLQSDRGKKGRDAGSHIPDGNGRDFFQFPFPHVRREIFFSIFHFACEK